MLGLLCWLIICGYLCYKDITKKAPAKAKKENPFKNFLFYKKKVGEGENQKEYLVFTILKEESNKIKKFKIYHDLKDAYNYKDYWSKKKKPPPPKF